VLDAKAGIHPAFGEIFNVAKLIGDSPDLR
jgi:hypothetical protein